MSWEAQAWAAKQKTGSSSAKIVLMGLASCAGSDHTAFPSVKWLCEFSELDRKTVIAALQRLADGMFPLIEDSGQRKGRTKQVKVYRLASAEALDANVDQDVAETVPKAEQSRKRNSSEKGLKQSRKRDTEPFMEPKTPINPKGLKSPSPVSKTKSGGRRKKPASRLPDDWTPPPTGDLSAVAIKLVEQWPVGAYQAVCEAFRLHYQSTPYPGGRSPQWSAILSKWIVNDHAKIMRDAKAGVSFAALAPTTGAKTKRPNRPVQAKKRENQTSERIHSTLRRSIGGALHEQWIASAAILFEGEGVTVVATSEFVKGWIEDRFIDQIGKAAREATGGPIRYVKFRIEDGPR